MSRRRRERARRVGCRRSVTLATTAAPAATEGDDRAAIARPAAWDLFHRFVPRGALLLSVLTFIGYFLGLVRERILSQTFGIGDELDAFKAAFLIPELLFSVIVASGLAAPFIPIFTASSATTASRGPRLRPDGPDAGGRSSWASCRSSCSSSPR